jgi:hypothetical protein
MNKISLVLLKEKERDRDTVASHVSSMSCRIYLAFPFEEFPSMVVLPSGEEAA